MMMYDLYDSFTRYFSSSITVIISEENLIILMYLHNTHYISEYNNKEKYTYLLLIFIHTIDNTYDMSQSAAYYKLYLTCLFLK